VRIHRRATAGYHEYETILNIFVKNLGKSYTFSQFLFGSKNINELEMEAFLCRALYDEEGRFYFIINFKEFEPKVQSKLFNCIKEFESKH
jgi:hypothetical protein